MKIAQTVTYDPEQKKDIKYNNEIKSDYKEKRELKVACHFIFPQSKGFVINHFL